MLGGTGVRFPPAPPGCEELRAFAARSFSYPHFNPEVENDGDTQRTRAPYGPLSGLRRLAFDLCRRPCKIQIDAVCSSSGHSRRPRLIADRKGGGVADAVGQGARSDAASAAISRRKKTSLGPRRAIARSSQRML